MARRWSCPLEDLLADLLQRPCCHGAIAESRLCDPQCPQRGQPGAHKRSECARGSGPTADVAGGPLPRARTPSFFSSLRARYATCAQSLCIIAAREIALPLAQHIEHRPDVCRVILRTHRTDGRGRKCVAIRFRIQEFEQRLRAPRVWRKPPRPRIAAAWMSGFFSRPRVRTAESYALSR